MLSWVTFSYLLTEYMLVMSSMVLWMRNVPQGLRYLNTCFSIGGAHRGMLWGGTALLREAHCQEQTLGDDWLSSSLFLLHAWGYRCNLPASCPGWLPLCLPDVMDSYPLYRKNKLFLLQAAFDHGILLQQEKATNIPPLPRGDRDSWKHQIRFGVCHELSEQLHTIVV